MNDIDNTDTLDALAEATEATASKVRNERNDVHRPSVINPDDYTYVAQECMRMEGLGDALFMQEMRRRIQTHMKSTGGTYSRHQHGGNCHICGSVNAVYTVLFYHQPSNSYIRTGQDCADKLDNGCSFESNCFRAAVQDAREAQAGKKKAIAILGDHGLSAAWDIYMADYDAVATIPVRDHDAKDKPIVYMTLAYEERTIRDIVGKLVKYGSVSEPQIGFLKKLVEAIPGRKERDAARAAERAAEAESAENCPTGRIEVKGVVLSTREEITDFGTVTKMLVKAEQGFKVWVTAPRYASVAKGEPIHFKATITPSKDDPKFGIGKRPTMMAVKG